MISFPKYALYEHVEMYRVPVKLRGITQAQNKAGENRGELKYTRESTMPSIIYSNDWSSQSGTYALIRDGIRFITWGRLMRGGPVRTFHKRRNNPVGGHLLKNCRNGRKETFEQVLKVLRHICIQAEKWFGLGD